MNAIQATREYMQTREQTTKLSRDGKRVKIVYTVGSISRYITSLIKRTFVQTSNVSIIFFVIMEPLLLIHYQQVCRKLSSELINP